MRNGISISVIVRTLGRNGRLVEALESLANQSRHDFETVIVDMSDNQLASVLAPYHKQLPHLQHLPLGKPLSRAEALNLGIRNAAADKIAILDDDNLYDPIHLNVLIEGLERTGADLVYTGVRRTTYNQTGKLIDSTEWHQPYDFSKLMFCNYIHTSGTAFWKRTWERLGGYDPRFPVYEDLEFLLRAGAKGRIERLSAVTAESRSFTGKPGIQNHALERRNVRRSWGGLCWLYRDYLTRERRAAYARSLKAEGIVRPQFSLRAWASGRARTIIGLAEWWWLYALPAGKGSAKGLIDGTNDCAGSLQPPQP